MFGDGDFLKGKEIMGSESLIMESESLVAHGAECLKAGRVEFDRP